MGWREAAGSHQSGLPIFDRVQLAALLMSRLSSTAPPLLFLCRGWGPSGHAVRTAQRRDGGEDSRLPSPPVSTTPTMSSENTARRGQGEAVGFMAGGFAVLRTPFRRDYSQCAAYASTDQGAGKRRNSGMSNEQRLNMRRRAAP